MRANLRRFPLPLEFGPDSPELPPAVLWLVALTLCLSAATLLGLVCELIVRLIP